jgi:probable phosphoglycerate mutase
VPHGENLAQVAERARRVIARAVAARGDVLLFGHGHILRVLTACWLGLRPRDGRLFALSTAALGVLGEDSGTPVIRLWNVTARAAKPVRPSRAVSPGLGAHRAYP